jgi:putative flavoprotein involved in K+ transport
MQGTVKGHGTSSGDAGCDVDILIIGGGQAGLAAGYYLNRLRRDEASGRSGPAPSFAILDANQEPGGAWQHYWASLELFSPAASSSLPGYQMPAQAGGGNPTARHVRDYLRSYESRYKLPIHRPVRATAVHRAPDGGYITDTTRGQWTSRVVINATGTWDAPYLPQLAGAGSFHGRQLHTADYRGPEPFAGLKVAVVGGGNSGAQIAADLIPGASVTWVTRKPPRYLPDDVDGTELFRIATRHVRALAAGEPSPGTAASLGDIVAVPAVRKARDAGLLQARPLFSRFVPDGVQWPNGEHAAVDIVLWCTGFRPALAHLQPLSLQPERGAPATEPHPATRSADSPDLFFLGYGDWCGPASATLIGVGASARDTVAAAAALAAEARAEAPGS